MHKPAALAALAGVTGLAAIDYLPHPAAAVVWAASIALVVAATVRIALGPTERPIEHDLDVYATDAADDLLADHEARRAR